MRVVILVIFSALQFVSCKNPPSTDSVRYSEIPVREPALFAPGVISTETNSEFSLTFTPDGRTVYFSRRAPGEKQKIFRTTFIDGKWTIPEITSFSTDRDETPSITPDGQMFFFGSERPIPGTPNKGNFDMNVWMMKKQADGWSDAAPLPFPINDVQIEGEEWPSSNNNFFFPVDDSTFYFTTMKRGEKSVTLYETKYINNAFSEPKEITGIWDDEKYWIYSAVVSPDGKYLLFNSYGAPGGDGGEDLYVSKRTNGVWSNARAMGNGINTSNEESSPRFSRDGKYFFFARAENLGNYEYGEWNIFYIETEALDLDTLFEE